MLSKRPRSRTIVVILVAMLVTIAFTGPLVSAASSGYITGQVTNENNEALPDATVRVVASDTGEVVTTTTTNQEGEYTVGVDPGEYLVEAEYNGETESTQNFTVSEGDTSTKNIVIMGVSPEPATGEIAGDVVNENNDALPGATVTLIRSDSGNVVATTTADDYGSYVFQDVETGDYRVEAEFDGETGFTTVTVYEGTNTADIVISGISTEPATGSISGVVTDEDDKALSDATVRLVNSSTGTVVTTTTTDHEGRYTFAGVEVGKYKVEAEYNNEVGSTTVTVSEDTTTAANIVISGLDSESSAKAAISVDAPQSITSGETSELTIVVENSGSAVASSGGLEISLSGPVSIESVSGDGTGSPERFFVTPLSPGDSRTVTYTLRAEDSVTGDASIATTATVGGDIALSQVTIPVKDTPETLGEYYRQDDGEVGFLEVLEAINAYNSDKTRLSGYGEVKFLDILDLIAAYNE